MKKPNKETQSVIKLTETDFVTRKEVLEPVRRIVPSQLEDKNMEIEERDGLSRETGYRVGFSLSLS